MRINGILVAIAITFSLLLAIVGCGGGSSDSTNNDTGGQTGPGPRILSIAPNPAKPGDTITINGANFGSATDEVMVKFQVTPQSGTGPQYITGVIKSRTETEIKALVPAGAVDGVILIIVNDGNGPITSIADGNAKIIIGSSSGSTDPVIVSLQPDTGKVYDEIVLNGFNFGEFASGVSKIVFSSYDPITKLTSEIEAVRGVDRAGTIVQINNDKDLILGEQPFYVVKAYDNTGKPVIDDITGKTKIVKTNWTGSSIKVMIPSDASSGNVYLYRGTVKSNSTFFTFISSGVQGQPVVYKMSPNRGKPGSYVNIEGKNFGQREGTATINYKKADGKLYSIRPEDVVKWQSDTIQIRIPQDAITGFLEVVTSTGLTNFPAGFPTKVDTTNSASYLNVIRVPSIHALSPSNIVIGQQVIILGSDFGTDKGKVVAEGVNVNANDIIAWNETTIVIKPFPLVSIPSTRDYGLIYVERADSTTTDPLISNNFKFTIRSVIEVTLSASVFPVTGVAGQFNLKLTGTANKGTPPYSYNFDFGDGTTDLKTNITASYTSSEHNYSIESPKAGYTAKLTVRDAAGAVSEVKLSSPVKVVAADRPVVTSIELIREGGTIQQYTFNFNDQKTTGGADDPQQTGIYPLWVGAGGQITCPGATGVVFDTSRLEARKFTNNQYMPWDVPAKGSIKLMQKMAIGDVDPGVYLSGYGNYARNRDILGFHDVFGTGTVEEATIGTTPAPYNWFGTWFQRVAGTASPNKTGVGFVARFYSGEGVNIMTGEMNPGNYFGTSPTAYRAPGATLGRPFAHPGDRILIRGFNFGSDYTQGIVTITPIGSSNPALKATGEDNFDESIYNPADANGYVDLDPVRDFLTIVRWEDNKIGASPTTDTGLKPVMKPGDDGYTNDNPNPNPTGEDYIELIIPCIQDTNNSPPSTYNYLVNDTNLEGRTSGRVQVDTKTKSGQSESNILFAPRIVSTFDGTNYGATLGTALDAKIAQVWQVSDAFTDLEFFNFGADQNPELINYDTKTFIGVQPTFNQGGTDFIPWMRTYWITPTSIDPLVNTVTFDLSTLPATDTIFTNSNISAGLWRFFIWSGARKSPPTSQQECDAGIVSFPIVRYIKP